MRTNEESRQPGAHAIDAGGDQHDRADAVEQAGAGGQQADASDEAEASGFIHRRHFIAVAPLWFADREEQYGSEKQDGNARGDERPAPVGNLDDPAAYEEDRQSVVEGKRG